MFDPLPNPSYAPLILVIDDEPKNVQVVGALLLKHGYEVVAANHAVAALAKLETMTPDLILLDVMMPGMTGFELSRRLRMNDVWKNIPVIFLSAASDKDFIVNALEAGGVDYLTKPFHGMELITRLQVHLNLQSTRKRLASTLRERNRLLEVVAHDLKNPLGGIRFAAAMMEENKDLDARTKMLAESISDSTNRAFEIVNNLLQTRRLEEAMQRLECRPLNLSNHVERAVKMFDQHGRSKDIRIQTALPDGEILIQADSAALMCSLENLLSNAIKFSPKGSVVHVHVNSDGQHGTFVVEDQGPGISKEDEKFLFQKFTRLSARPTQDEASTGLGLYIVHELVQAMGGGVQHRPSQHGGACFEIRVPLTNS